MTENEHQFISFPSTLVTVCAHFDIARAEVHATLTWHDEPDALDAAAICKRFTEFLDWLSVNTPPIRNGSDEWIVLLHVDIDTSFNDLAEAVKFWEPVAFEIGRFAQFVALEIRDAGTKMCHVYKSVPGNTVRPGAEMPPDDLRKAMLGTPGTVLPISGTADSDQLQRAM